MIDFLLVLSNLLFGVSILAYFYFREVKNQDRNFQQFKQVTDDLAINFEESLKMITEVTKSKDNLTQKALLEYLKHNERLERMILPQPVTRKAVQDILDQTPPMVPFRENEIDKMDVELQNDELNEMISRIPITKNTKVKFEGDVELPEEIIQDAVSGKDVMSGKLSD